AEDALERLFTNDGSWRDLIALLRERQARAGSNDAKVELLYRIAWVEEEKLEDVPATAAVLREILALDPDNARALRAAATAAEATSDWKGLAEIVRKQVELRLDDEHASLLLRLAKLEETELKDSKAAYAAYLRALEVDTISAEAVAGLQRLLDGGKFSGAE